MRKRIIISAIVIFLLIGFWYFKYIYGWLEFRKNTDTPEAFLNTTKVSQGQYHQDSLQIINELHKELSRHVDFFDNSSYADSTVLIIDSIIYSPDYKRNAVLVIVQNLTAELLMPNTENKWYYDATGYVALKRNDSFLLKWVGPNFSESDSREKASKYLRRGCFETFAKPDSGEDFYNMNDKRFWTGPMWNDFYK